MKNTNWKDLVGERVLVYLSPYATTACDLRVTEYKDGMVGFDDGSSLYNEDTIILKEVFMSKKYTNGWTWSEPE
jgi:hypothetical protein